MSCRAPAYCSRGSIHGFPLIESHRQFAIGVKFSYMTQRVRQSCRFHGASLGLVLEPFVSKIASRWPCSSAARADLRVLSRKPAVKPLRHSRCSVGTELTRTSVMNSNVAKFKNARDVVGPGRLDLLNLSSGRGVHKLERCPPCL